MPTTNYLLIATLGAAFNYFPKTCNSFPGREKIHFRDGIYLLDIQLVVTMAQPLAI
jgi:hypothetical protein